MTDRQKQQIVAALTYISPIFSKNNFHWCISDALARYIYGLGDDVKEIAIDLDVDKDDEKFKQFLEDVRGHTTLPLNHTHDEIWEHYVMEVTVDGVILSICPTQNMNIFNKKSGKYESFYKDGIPTPNMVMFEGIQIPLLPKENFVEMENNLGK